MVSSLDSRASSMTTGSYLSSKPPYGLRGLRSKFKFKQQRRCIDSENDDGEDDTTPMKNNLSSRRDGLSTIMTSASGSVLMSDSGSSSSGSSLQEYYDDGYNNNNNNNVNSNNNRQQQQQQYQQPILPQPPIQQQQQQPKLKPTKRRPSQQQPQQQQPQMVVQGQYYQPQYRPKPPKPPRIYDPSRHFHSYLYLTLFVISMICIGALAIATPSQLRSLAERVVLGFIGISAILSLLTAFVLRYKPSKTSVTQSIRMEVAQLGTLEFKSLACLAAILFLVLWTCIGIIVLLIPEESIGVAGQVEIWNSNLYLGTWVGFFVSCWVFADCCVLCSSGGDKEEHMHHHHHRANNVLIQDNPKAKVRNKIARGWILLLIFSVVLVAFSSSLLGGPTCTGTPRLEYATVCSRMPFGLVLGVLGALVAAFDWVIRRIQAYLELESDTNNKHRVFWSTSVDRASFGLCVIVLCMFAVNAGLLTSPTSAGIGAEWSGPCNTYLASWTCFGICLYLFLKHVEIWSAQPWIEREAVGSYQRPGMEYYANSFSTQSQQSKMDGIAPPVEAPVVVEQVQVQPQYIPIQYHKVRLIRGSRLESIDTGGDTSGHSSSSSSSSFTGTSYSFTYNEETGMPSTAYTTTYASGSISGTSTSASGASASVSTSYYTKSESTYTGPTTISDDASSDPTPTGMIRYPDLPWHQPFQQYGGQQRRLGPGPLNLGTIPGRGGRRPKPAPPAKTKPYGAKQQPTPGAKPYVISSENASEVSSISMNIQLKPPDPDMQSYHGRARASKDSSSKDPTPAKNVPKEPAVQQQKYQPVRNKQYAPTKQPQSQPQSPQTPLQKHLSSRGQPMKPSRQTPGSKPQPVRAQQQKQPPIVLPPPDKPARTQPRPQQQPTKQHRESTFSQKLEQQVNERQRQKEKESSFMTESHSSQSSVLPPTGQTARTQPMPQQQPPKQHRESSFSQKLEQQVNERQMQKEKSFMTEPHSGQSKPRPGLRPRPPPVELSSRQRPSSQQRPRSGSGPRPPVEPSSRQRPRPPPAQELTARQKLDHKLKEKQRSFMTESMNGQSRPGSARMRPPAEPSNRPGSRQRPQPPMEPKNAHHRASLRSKLSSNHGQSGRSRPAQRKPSQLEPEESTIGSSVPSLDTFRSKAKDPQPTRRPQAKKGQSPNPVASRDTLIDAVRREQMLQCEEDELMKKVQASSFTDRQWNRSFNRMESLSSDPKATTSGIQAIQEAVAARQWNKDREALEVAKRKRAQHLAEERRRAGASPGRGRGREQSRNSMSSSRGRPAMTPLVDQSLESKSLSTSEDFSVGTKPWTINITSGSKDDDDSSDITVPSLHSAATLPARRDTRIPSFASSTGGRTHDEMTSTGGRTRDDMVESVSSGSDESSPDPSTISSTATIHGPMTISDGDELSPDDRARWVALEIAELASTRAGRDPSDDRLFDSRMPSHQARGDAVDSSRALLSQPSSRGGERDGIEVFGLYDRQGLWESDASKKRVLSELAGGTPASQVYPTNAAARRVILFDAVAAASNPPHSQQDSSATPRPSAEKRQSKSRFFSQFDINDDGIIDREEMKEMFRVKMNMTLTDAQTERVFKAIDTDGDGKIDVAEFDNWCLKQSFGGKKKPLPPEEQPWQRPRGESFMTESPRASMSSVRTESARSRAASISSFKTESVGTQNSVKAETNPKSQGEGSSSRTTPPRTARKKSFTSSTVSAKSPRPSRVGIPPQELGGEDEVKLSPLSDLSDSPARARGSSSLTAGSGARQSAPNTLISGTAIEEEGTDSTGICSDGMQHSRSETLLSKSTMSAMSSQTIPNNETLMVDQIVAAALKQAQDLEQMHNAPQDL